MKEILKVERVLDLKEGQSDNGVFWEKQTVVFSRMGDSPTMLAVTFVGERKTKVTKCLVVGQVCEVTYGVKSREFEGKWYTDVEGFSCALLQRVQEPENTTPEKPDR